MNKLRKLLLLVLVLSSGIASAQEICPLIPKPSGELKSIKEFASLAVLHDGRVKPMDTFARHVLLQISGKTTYDKREAVRWLAGLLFASPEIRGQKVFLINNPEIAETLGVEPEKRRLYSFDQLEKGLPVVMDLAKTSRSIEEKNRSIVETEIIRLENNLRLFIQLTHVFQFAAQHPDFQVHTKDLKEELGFPKNQTYFSFLMIALQADALNEITRGLERKDRSLWSAKEKDAFQLAANLYTWATYYNHLPVQIIPASDQENNTWLTPWDAIHYAFHDPQIRQEVYLLSDMYLAQWEGNQIRFDLALRSFSESVEKRLSNHNMTLPPIQLEILLNKMKVFFWAKAFYLLAFLICILSLIKSYRWIYKLCVFLVSAGLSAQAVGFIMRMIILQRPPVSTLYETFIFVAFISVLLGLVIERVHKKWLGLCIAGISGFIFLMIASKFAAEGDTLKMLVAVLNSNFWLSTHVISITIGYAGVCVAGVVGHIYILQKIFHPANKQLLEETQRVLLGTLGFGLTMTFLGTNLGGIWADASWGRFWGWDPKENGALLIVLWTALLFHLKVGKLIGPFGLAVGSVLGGVVVMWAWFGVNLLSVGLHSYGFTSGLARNLLIYVLCQFLFLTIAIPLARRT